MFPVIDKKPANFYRLSLKTDFVRAAPYGELFGRAQEVFSESATILAQNSYLSGPTFMTCSSGLSAEEIVQRFPGVVEEAVPIPHARELPRMNFVI